ncbi:GemA protein [Desulfosarcina widdelii]|uniref:GemA protein n=1 Tax=Desulfosarcina widdelii TaxID=947919 RepID=A0A5K7ZGG8_9BACT|nr:regulatory protein GemA [Desulfosarcina widdelii]BBO75197.1 GemA protein [Desulfosarcina widdelii]
MMNAQARKERRRRELALIHIAAKQLNIKENVYRGLVLYASKDDCDSAADLDAAGRQALIRIFKKMGFRPVHKSAMASGMHKPPSWERGPQLSKIGAILADLCYPWRYADAIAKRMYGVDFVRFCYPYQLQGVIAALLARQKKVKIQNSKRKNAK